MKQTIANRVHDYYWQQDLCCALTALNVLGELFDCTPSPELTAATYGLNAGRCGSQCGLAAGPLLFFGLYGQQRQWPAEKIQRLCRHFSAEFEQTFSSRLCLELRPQGFAPSNPPHLCENLSCRAIELAARILSEPDSN